ncbi:hypothetical protein EDB86DRAFT_2831774 [Lactarius hatsudake]|nr:hypothetical protein EDB86DRAFT_2831774 [Lactarius hatsudake]
MHKRRSRLVAPPCFPQSGNPSTFVRDLYGSQSPTIPRTFEMHSLFAPMVYGDETARMRSPARQFVHCLIPACATPAVRGTRELSATPTNNVKSARASHGLKASFAATRYGKDERGHGASAMDFADSAAPHMLCGGGGDMGSLGERTGTRNVGVCARITCMRVARQVLITRSWQQQSGVAVFQDILQFSSSCASLDWAWVYSGASSTRSEQKRRPRREGTTVPTPKAKWLRLILTTIITRGLQYRKNLQSAAGTGVQVRRNGGSELGLVGQPPSMAPNTGWANQGRRFFLHSATKVWLKTHAQSKEGRGEAPKRRGNRNVFFLEQAHGAWSLALLSKATDTGPINSEVLADRPVLGRVRTREDGEDLSDLDLTSRPRRSPRDGVQLGAEAGGFFSGVCLEPQRRAYRNERTIHRVKGCVEAGEAGNRRVRSESWRAFWIGIKSSFSGAETEKEEEKMDQTQMTGLEE